MHTAMAMDDGTAFGRLECSSHLPESKVATITDFNSFTLTL